MSNGLTLPFSGTANIRGYAFEITNTSPGPGPLPVGNPPAAVAGIGTGVAGTGVVGTGGATGVEGFSQNGTGVSGSSPNGTGVSGSSVSGSGVSGVSTNGDGVNGRSARNGVVGRTASAGDSGVWGENTGAGYGVSGSTNSTFVVGADGKAGVWGHNFGSGMGVKGTSGGGDGVLGYTPAYPLIMVAVVLRFGPEVRLPGTLRGMLKLRETSVFPTRIAQRISTYRTSKRLSPER